MDPRREQRELAAGRAYRGRHAGPAVRSSAARPSRRLGIEGRRARRGRRDARSRLSRGSGIHPQDHAGRRAARCCSRRRCRAASSRWRSSISSDAFRIEVAGDEGGHADIEYRAIRIAAERCRARRRQRAALFRIAERAGVLQHARRRAASAGDAAGARLLRGRAVGRTDPERANACAAGAARRPRARLRRHRRGGARHRSAEPRSRHSCRSAERSGSDAASLRPHRPRRPQGRQRPAGAAGAPAARRSAAQSGRHRRRLGHGAAGRRNPQARSASACCRTRCSRRRRPRTI